MLATITLVMAVAPAGVGAQEDELEEPKPFLIARDPQTGEERWRRVASEAGVWEVIAEANGAVYVHETECGRGLSPTASFVARDARTGKVKWREPVRDLDATKFTVGGTVVLLDREGNLRGLSPANGRVVWDEVLPTGLVPVAGTDDLILLVQERIDRPRELRALDRETGATKWTNSSSRYLPGSWIDITVVQQDTAIVESGGPQGGQASIDLRTGQELWSKPIDRVNLEAEDGWPLLFAAFVDGQLGPPHAYRPRTREERWVAPQR